MANNRSLNQAHSVETMSKCHKFYRQQGWYLCSFVKHSVAFDSTNHFVFVSVKKCNINKPDTVSACGDEGESGFDNCLLNRFFGGTGGAPMHKKAR